MHLQAKSEGKAPSRQLNVMHAAVASGCEDASRQHCFTVHSTEDGTGGRAPMFELQADGTSEQQDWMTTIQACPGLELRPALPKWRHWLNIRQLQRACFC